MPTRRIFVKRAAATSLVFGAGITSVAYAGATASNGCSILQGRYLTGPNSGKYYCDIECGVATSCSWNCTDHAGVVRSGTADGGVDGNVPIFLCA